MKLEFELSLASDYHVGSGHRAGVLVDSALLRDHDGTPVLRGSMIAGLLRDALNDLLEFVPLQARRAEIEEGAMARLFGRESQPRRWIYTSARPADAGGAASGRWGAHDVARIRINPRSGRAAAHQLFVEEEGEGSLTFTFHARCPAPTVQDKKDAALLVAAALLVRRLGRARRRGRGECRLTLTNVSGGDFHYSSNEDNWQERALDAFRVHFLEEEAPADSANGSHEEPTIAADTSAIQTGGSPRRFFLLAYAQEPIIVAERSEAANAYEGLQVVPGVALLGALAGRAARALQLNGAAAPQDFVTLFFRGGVSVSGLLPAFSPTDSALSADYILAAVDAPLDLFTCEHYPAFARQERRHDSVRYALVPNGKPGPCPTCGARMKPASGFLTLERLPRADTPALREEAHIRLNRDTARVQSGNLYEYIGVDAGQWFVGELTCANDDCWKRLAQWLELDPDSQEEQTTRLEVGKGARRGYGGLQLTLRPLGDDEPSPWVGRPLEKRITAPDEPFSLTLLTDAIVLDRWMRAHSGFDASWVAALFGLKADEIELLGRFARTRPVDGFNNQRGLPRWRDRALLAGSTCGLRITAKGLQSLLESSTEIFDQSLADSEKQLLALRSRMARLEQEGFGLRRHEGFGRLAFNHPIYSSADDLEPLEKPRWATLGSGSHQLEELERFRRRWREHLDEQRWAQVENPAYDAIARLLALSRGDEPSVVKGRLTKLYDFEYLGEKALALRENTKRDSISKGLTFIQGLVDELERKKSTAEQWAVGLDMLADSVAAAARRP